MPSAGIDIGAKNTKVLVLDGKKVLSKTKVLTGLETRQAVEEAFEKALQAAGISKDKIGRVVVTGVGKQEFPFEHAEVSEVKADAKGLVFLFPAARTVIDVGAEEGRGIKCSPEGRVVDFTLNEKCAAGSGSFTEAMARALEVPVEELGGISRQSTQAIPMNAQCAVFAESEVVSLLHAKTSKPDIARAVHEAIASRISSMVRKIGIEKEVALIGGVAKNAGFVDALKSDLGLEVFVPAEPEFVGALGAALLAQEENGK